MVIDKFVICIDHFYNYILNFENSSMLGVKGAYTKPFFKQITFKNCITNIFDKNHI